MKVVLDRFGRVVIPKSARKKLGVVPGDSLELEVDQDRLTLSPVAEQGRLVRKGGVLIWQSCGPPLTEEVVDETRRRLIRERHAKLSGLE